MMHREHQTTQGGKARTHILEQFQTTLIRKGQIHDDQIGLQSLDGLHALCGAARLATNLETLMTLQQLSQPSPHDGVIVNEQEPG